MSTSSVPSRIRSYRDQEISKSPESSRKPIPADMKIENRLNMKDLERLQEAFMSDGDGYDNRLNLNKDQFCEALSILLNRGSRDEFSDLFERIDVTKENFVDWDKFASHMLLEFYEKDDRVKSTQVPQWKDLKTLPSPHKDVVQKMGFLKNTNRYVGISREGCISMWDTDLKLQRAIKTTTDSCRSRDLWVTDFVPLPNINKIALSFTSKEIAIYDLSTKLEFNCQYKVQGLEFTPLCLDYWSNPNNANDAIIVWGDIGGWVNALFFSSANIALFERPPAPAGEKQEPCLNVQLSDIIAGKYKNATFTRYQGHSDWVRQVMFSQYLECFISCATTNDNSLAIGWMEKHMIVNQSMGKEVKKEIQRLSTFQITQGVNAFCYSAHLNLIATAGVNQHVCLWNPYVVSKPNGVLRGHMASVIAVQFIKSRAQLISFSKDKVLRIWDVQLQVCIQRLAGMFPKGAEVQSTLFFDESKDRNGNDRNRLFITFNYQLTLMEMKLEIKDRIMSHEKPVVAAVFNSAYNQVVSVCQLGNIIVWMVDTGQKVKQFNNAHGNSEVTCIALDQSETRLFTGSTDGTIKVWDFNGHCYHTLECSAGQPADVGQILILKRTVLVVGWARYVAVFRNTSFREFHVQPADWKGGQAHAEDILSLAFIAPNVLASGSCDGEIVIWNTNSEQASKHLNQRSRRKMLKSRGTTFTFNKQSTTVKNTAGEESSDAQNTSSSRPKSRPFSRTLASRGSQGSSVEGTEFSWAISKMIFLEARKGNSAGGGANLVSCGGNGWVRFWNTSHNTLLGEFIAHTHAGNMLMCSDKKNQYLVTGDSDGIVKVWEIIEYCCHSTDEIITVHPPMKVQFQPHLDMITSLELCERNDRLIIISASSDCSVQLWDIYGNKIGIFGQEEHWKIDSSPPITFQDEDSESLNEENADVGKDNLHIDADDDSMWEPDQEAVADPTSFRVNSWDKTFLGKDYQELRVKKRERKQPGTIPNLPYLHWEKTGQPPAGPYSALDTTGLEDTSSLHKPEVEKYFHSGESAGLIPKLPALSESLKTAFDEKSLFPKYILDYEMKMKNYHNMVLSQNQPPKLNKRTSLQTIGFQLGQSGGKSSISPTRKSNKTLKLKPLEIARRASILRASEGE